MNQLRIHNRKQISVLELQRQHTTPLTALDTAREKCRAERSLTAGIASGLLAPLVCARALCVQ